MTVRMRSAQFSMLVPNPWEADWTEVDRILCDQWPGPPGVGAAIIAMQGLGLDSQQASQLVAMQGGTNLSSGALSTAVGQTLNPPPAGSPGGGPPLPIALGGSVATNGGRLPITPTVNPQLQFLAGDDNRSFLLIQNNEPTSGGATLLMSTDQINTATPGFYVNFGPGGNGLMLDQNQITNPIYLGWSGSPTVGGVCIYASKPGTKPPSTYGASYRAPVQPPPSSPYSGF